MTFINFKYLPLLSVPFAKMKDMNKGKEATECILSHAY